jgi:hypothetical protein
MLCPVTRDAAWITAQAPLAIRGLENLASYLETGYLGEFRSMRI